MRKNSKANPTGFVLPTAQPECQGLADMVLIKGTRAFVTVTAACGHESIVNS